MHTHIQYIHYITHTYKQTCIRALHTYITYIYACMHYITYIHAYISPTHITDIHALHAYMHRIHTPTCIHTLHKYIHDTSCIQYRSYIRTRMHIYIYICMYVLYNNNKKIYVYIYIYISYIYICACITLQSDREQRITTTDCEHLDCCTHPKSGDPLINTRCIAIKQQPIKTDHEGPFADMLRSADCSLTVHYIPMHASMHTYIRRTHVLHT